MLSLRTADGLSNEVKTVTRKSLHCAGCFRQLVSDSCKIMEARTLAAQIL